MFSFFIEIILIGGEKLMAVAGLVCGIVATVFGVFFSWTGVAQIIGLVLGVAGIVLSVLGSKQCAVTGQPKGAATAGLILSIIGLIFCAIFTFVCVVCPCICMSEAEKELASALNELSRYY